MELPVFNHQPVEKSDYRDGSLDIVDIWSTIQGEGPFAGVPAVFVRLAGCNLTCPLCDTDYTTGRRLYDITEAYSRIREKAKDSGHFPINLVVFTGGEPFRQNLSPLVRSLIANGYRVQVETNGTLYDNLFPYAEVCIVCSPKTPSISKFLLPYITAFKYVLEAGYVDEATGLPTRALGGVPPWLWGRDGVGYVGRGEVYVQPADEQDPVKNRENLKVAAEMCLAHGYRLGLQIHKIAGLP